MRITVILCASSILAGDGVASVRAQSVREHTRLSPNRPTAVTEAQASELTLTLTEAAVRPIQVWVRTAGIVDHSRRMITAELTADQRAHVKVGQRVRAFSPESRSRMYQATVSAVAAQANRVVVKAALMAQALEQSQHYILEIVTEGGEFLSVPNEAIIETGGRTLVYVQDAAGGYTPREIRPGMQGELFTQVLDGLKAGEKVVTIGSFFIDAEQKLKGS